MAGATASTTSGTQGSVEIREDSLLNHAQSRMYALRSRTSDQSLLIQGAGQPGPQAENRVWGQSIGGAVDFCHRVTVSIMSREKRTSLKSTLAAAIAEGKSSAEWASANRVAERTAQRWANDPAIRAEVETIRRAALDQAIGRMSRRVAWATEQIATLAADAKSESVRLAALRSILIDVMAVTEFTGLEFRIAKLEEQDHVRHEESTSFAG